MRCRECGAILLDTDTFCGKCGTKVKINICPECGETLRPGMRFCASCGYEVVGREEFVEVEDEEIPVTGGLKTTEIPFDLIEQSIIKDVERQLDYAEDEAYAEDNYDSYEDGFEYQGSESDDYDDEYSEEYDDYNDYVEEDEEFYEDEPQSLASRLLTAAMIVIGIIILIIVSSFFFKNRENKNDDKPAVEENTDEESENTEEESDNDSTIGTIEIVQNVNIRDYPDKDNSNILGVAKAGETYGYYGFAENNENWVHIKVDDSTDGYVYKGYVNIKE